MPQYDDLNWDYTRTSCCCWVQGHARVLSLHGDDPAVAIK